MFFGRRETPRLVVPRDEASTAFTVVTFVVVALCLVVGFLTVDFFAVDAAFLVAINFPPYSEI
jgi:hypothetical protein